MVHEIGHALGMWHEQQRLDRDNHIRVLEDNLGSYSGQYRKAYYVEDYGVEYTYGSVMHYGAKVRALFSIKLITLWYL